MLITKFQSFSCPLFLCTLTAHRKLKLRIKYRLCLKLQQSCSFVTLLNGWWPPLFSFHRALNFLIFCILTKKKKKQKKPVCEKLQSFHLFCWALLQWKFSSNAHGRARINLYFYHGLLYLKESICTSCITKKKQHLLKTYTFKTASKVAGLLKREKCYSLQPAAIFACHPKPSPNNFWKFKKRLCIIKFILLEQTGLLSKKYTWIRKLWHNY